MTELIKQIELISPFNTWGDVLEIEVPDPFNNLLIYVKEGNANALKWRVRGSSDHVNYKTLTSGGERTIAKDGDDYETLSDAWRWVLVQAKTAVDSAWGLISVYFSGLT